MPCSWLRRIAGDFPAHRGMLKLGGCGASALICPKNDVIARTQTCVTLPESKLNSARTSSE